MGVGKHGAYCPQKLQGSLGTGRRGGLLGTGRRAVGGMEVK